MLVLAVCVERSGYGQQRDDDACKENQSTFGLALFHGETLSRGKLNLTNIAWHARAIVLVPKDHCLCTFKAGNLIPSRTQPHGAAIRLEGGRQCCFDILPDA